MLRSFMNTSAKLEVIGLSGTLASGKDTVSHYLVESLGYTHVSTSDIVREIAMEEEGSVERPVLYEVAKRHRYAEGAGFLVMRGLEKPKPLVISGLRTIGEAKAIKAAGGTLLFIDAPIEVRYERMKTRSRDSEIALTLDQFRDNEQKEWHAGDNDADFNFRDIKAMSDVIVENVLPIDQFVELVVRKLGLTS